MTDSPGKSPRRKSKRRSSFAASRINILPKGRSGSELYKDIDPNKSPEERLIMLSKACLEYTLKKMREEMSGCRDFDTYKREVEEAVLRKIADMEMSGKFKEATEKEKTLPNPINQEMDTAVEHLKVKISRLKKESEKWDALLTDKEDQISEYTRIAETREISEHELPDTVKTQASSYLDTRLDLPNILNDVDKSMKKTCLMIHEHSRIVGKLNTAFNHASKTIHGHEEKMNKLQKPEDTPRQVMATLSAFPTPR